MHSDTLPAPESSAATSGGWPLTIDGSWLKIARLFDELWLQPPWVENPDALVATLRQREVVPDLFTFGQPVPETERKHRYYFEWDNAAVANTTRFQDWWDGLPHESRKNVRKAQKRGVVVAPVPFSDELVRGIKALYDETPLRQGRKFWHFGKDLETVRRENATYLERSHFVAAHLGGELIGFIKFVEVGTTARIMQILTHTGHMDKHPTNALLAGAVEHCGRRNLTHLIYGQYVYGRKHGSSVTEFKRRNGFSALLTPRYYIPLTMKGRVALALRLHRRLNERLPEPLLNALLKARSSAYQTLFSRARTPQLPARRTA